MVLFLVPRSASLNSGRVYARVLQCIEFTVLDTFETVSTRFRRESLFLGTVFSSCSPILTMAAFQAGYHALPSILRLARCLAYDGSRRSLRLSITKLPPLRRSDMRRVEGMAVIHARVRTAAIFIAFYHLVEGIYGPTVICWTYS